MTARDDRQSPHLPGDLDERNPGRQQSPRRAGLPISPVDVPAYRGRRLGRRKFGDQLIMKEADTRNACKTAGDLSHRLEGTKLMELRILQRHIVVDT